MESWNFLYRKPIATLLYLRDGVQPTAEGGQNMFFNDFGVGVGANEKQSQSAG